MSSTSDSSVDELRALRSALASYAARPNLYGSPEQVEGLAMHVTHVLFTIGHSAWSFRDTEAFWRELASALGFGARCAQDEEAYKIKRWWRWGSEEARARLQVRGAYRRIWRRLRHLDGGRPQTQGWIRALLATPRLAGPPDVLETVLWGLTSIVLEEQLEAFITLLDEELRRAGANSLRRLADVGTEAEWLARAPEDSIPDFTSELRVATGIREALRRIPLFDA